MTHKAEQAYAQWQQADSEARQAENRLKAAWIAHDMGGELPSKELMAEVSRLRAIASEKLKAAVGALSSPKTPKDSGK